MSLPADPVVPNLLGTATSPYLRQHAANPVAWQPWGTEAFALAQALDRPVFLSVGSSTCHWCHVMARESFENPDVAEILNRHFVSVKVDREERPDIDRLYMSFVQRSTGQGGWPMSVWLTPEGRPFYGGTYFPPQGAYGRPGFSDLLLNIAKLWRERRGELCAQADRVMETLENLPTHDASLMSGVPEGASKTALLHFARQYDPMLGGFGDAPKFPRPSALMFLLETTDGAAMAIETLRHMAAGGIRDHLGGGFHRYAVDARWHVPHFEKMLYDQAQIAMACLRAYRVAGDSDFADVARGILEYANRDLRHPDGGYFSAEDADSPPPDAPDRHAEGAFYVWSAEEIDRVLGEDAPLFRMAYGVEPEGNVNPGNDPHEEFAGLNILFRTASEQELARYFSLEPGEVAHRLEHARNLLFECRAARPRPHRDEKILVAWNGLMISALARAAQVLGEAGYADDAGCAADFVWERLRDSEGRLVRSHHDGPGDAPAFAEDYAFFIQGLLDLYETTLDPRRLRQALELQEEMDLLFSDSEGGYFGSRAGDALVPVRIREDHDGAEPAASSVAAWNLLRLSRMTGRPGLQEQADRLFGAFSETLTRMPSALPQMLGAADFDACSPVSLVVTGDPGDALTRDLLAGVHHHRPYGSTVIGIHDPQTREEFSRELPYLKEIPWQMPSVYLCENHTCRLPVHTRADLDRLFTSLAG